MAEEKAKKNPDFTEKAVNLVNPPEVKAALDELHQRQHHQADLITRRAALDPALDAEIIAGDAQMTELKSRLAALIKEFGSYQNIEASEYALIYRAKFTEYHHEPFIEHFSQYVPAVIVQMINPQALEGLIKGGLVKKEDLEQLGVIKYQYQERIIIK